MLGTRPRALWNFLECSANSSAALKLRYDCFAIYTFRYTLHYTLLSRDEDLTRLFLHSRAPSAPCLTWQNCKPWNSKPVEIWPPVPQDCVTLLYFGAGPHFILHYASGQCCSACPSAPVLLGTRFFRSTSWGLLASPLVREFVYSLVARLPMKCRGADNSTVPGCLFSGRWEPRWATGDGQYAIETLSNFIVFEWLPSTVVAPHNSWLVTKAKE